LFGLASFFSVEVQQIEFGQNVGSLLKFMAGGKVARSKLNSILINKFEFKAFELLLTAG